MATMPRNMVTLGTTSLPNDLHSEPKWSNVDVKNRLKTDFKANMQHITKHYYLLRLRHTLPAQGAPLVTPLGPKAVQSARKCHFWAAWGGASKQTFFWRDPDAHFYSKLTPF